MTLLNVRLQVWSLQTAGLVDVVRQFNVRLEVCSFRLQVWWMLSASIKWDWRSGPSRLQVWWMLSANIKWDWRSIPSRLCQYKVGLQVWWMLCVSLMSAWRSVPS